MRFSLQSTILLAPPLVLPRRTFKKYACQKKKQIEMCAKPKVEMGSANVVITSVHWFNYFSVSYQFSVSPYGVSVSIKLPFSPSECSAKRFYKK